MSTVVTRPTPLLAAFRERRAVREKGLPGTGTLFADFITLLGCLLPVSICVYLASDKPLFAIKSVEFTHPDLVCGVLVLAVLFRAIFVGFHRVPGLLWVPILLFLISTLLSALFAADKLRGVAAIIQIVEFFLVAWSFAVITDEGRFLRVVRFTLGVFAFEAVVALTQLVTTENFPRGTFMVHQTYANFIGMGAIMAFTLWTTAKPGRNRLLFGLLAITLVIGSLLAQERLPWASFIVAATVVVFCSGKRKTLIKGLVVTLLAVVILVAAAPPLRQMTVARFAEAQGTTAGQNSLLSRLVLWSIAYKFFVSHPVLGVGPKSYVSLVPHYATVEELMGEEALDPHNVWIGTLAEQGVVGFITYLVFNWGLMKLAGLKLRARMTSTAQSLSLAYLGCIVFWTCMSFTFFMKSNGHLLFMFIGLMAGLYQRYSSLPETHGAASSLEPQTQPA